MFQLKPKNRSVTYTVKREILVEELENHIALTTGNIFVNRLQSCTRSLVLILLKTAVQMKALTSQKQKLKPDFELVDCTSDDAERELLAKDKGYVRQN